MTSTPDFDVVTREDAAVVCAVVPGSPEDIGGAASEAFRRLEQAVPLSGGDVYGYWDPSARVYCACATRGDGDPDEPGLERRSIPGGRYRRARLNGDDAFDRIGPTFDALSESADVDGSRPFLERYTGPGEVDVLVPVRD